MDSESHQNEDAKLLSTSTIYPLQTLSNLDSTASRRYSTDPISNPSGSATSRDSSFKNGFNVVKKPDMRAEQTFQQYSSWDRLRLWIGQKTVDRWIVELSACGGSVLALFAIFILLNHYNGRAQPDWPYNITINSMISFFTTLMKALMLVSVTACLSQTNWIYFRTTPHTFKDFLVCDSASRGPEGSMQLLWDSRAR